MREFVPRCCGPHGEIWLGAVHGDGPSVQHGLDRPKQTPKQRNHPSHDPPGCTAHGRNTEAGHAHRPTILAWHRPRLLPVDLMAEIPADWEPPPCGLG